MRCRLLLVAVALLAAGCSVSEDEPELQPGVLRVGVLAERSPGVAEDERFISQGAEVAAAELNNAGGIGGVLRVRLVFGDPDGSDASYERLARELGEHGAKAVILPCGAHAAVAASALAADHPDVLLLAPCAALGEAPSGSRRTGVGARHPDARGRPIAGSELDELHERYKALFGRRPPSNVPALGYDAIRVLAAAIEEASTMNPAAVAATLRAGLEVGGAFGTIRYDEGRLEPEIEVRYVER